MDFNQNIFYDEFLNKLNLLHNSLVDLQKNHTDQELINEIFRSVHTIKSSADLLGMFDVVDITHKAEDLLVEIRNGKMTVNDKLLESFFLLGDYLKNSINNLLEGIYDDSSTQDLAIYLRHEFEKYLEDPELLNKKTILVLESSSLNRYMIKKIAQDLGHDVYIVDNGIDALKKIEEKEVDIIFGDVTDECDKCAAFIQQIKNDILYDHIPVVMLVDIMSERMKHIGKIIKAKAWLAKPIQHDQVVGILNKLVA